MAVKAKAQITISVIIDIDKVTRYYLLQSSTAAAPSKPTDGDAIGSKWSKTEPSYSSGSTNTLYFVDQTIMTNGAIKYSEVSKSSSYEAAKEAWNKANNAQNTANNVNSNLNKLTGDPSNYSQLNDSTAATWGFAKDSTADGHWYTVNALKRTIYISDKYDCYGAKKFRIRFDISTSVQGNTTNSTTTITKDYLNVSVAIYCYDDNDTVLSLIQSKNTKGTASATVASVDTSVTTHANTRRIKVCVRCDGWNNFSGKLKIRNVRVTAVDALTSVDVEYYLSTSATSLAGGSWTTTAPAWVNGKYMWSRTVKIDGAGTKTYSPSQNGVCIAGAKGNTGAKGDKGDKGDAGGAGKGVKSIVEQYYKSTSSTTQSGGSWGTTYPGWENGKYIWTRSVITYTDNTTTTTSAICVTGAKGDKGNTGSTGATGPTGPSGKGIKSSAITYQLSTSRTTPPTGTWVTSPPATDIDKPYLWTRTIITYTDNTTSSPAYSVSSTLDSLLIGGRNLIRNGKGGEKAGFFKNFDTAANGYCGFTLKSKNDYVRVVLEGFVLGIRDYTVGEKVTWSYDIMYTAWNFPSGTTRSDFWMGQRYGKDPSGATDTGSYRHVTSHRLPEVGVNGCVLNKWYHVVKTITIPEQASTKITTTEAYIQFCNKSDTEASFSARIKNVKLEKGNVATDWSAAPEDLESRVTSAESSISNNSKEIKLKASQETVTALSKDYNAYKKTTTEFTQNIDGWRMDWNKLISTDEAEVASHQDYITFQKGNILLGDSASNLKLKLTKNSIQFKGTSDTEVTPDSDATAWITGKTFHIDTGEIKSSLKFGNILMKPTSAGNLAIGDAAEFGSTVRIGLTTGRNIILGKNGFIVNHQRTSIAHIGYSSFGSSVSGNSEYPFYVFGIPKEGMRVGGCSSTEGYLSGANGFASHAEGWGSLASGQGSHAEGGSTASGDTAHAEGSSTTASGNKSHTEGMSTIASGQCSHAEGNWTTASGTNSHAEGFYTTASGDHSNASGWGTTAASEAQTAIGEYNIIDSAEKYLFIVGNGTSESERSNAFGVRKSGTVDISGDTLLTKNNTALYGTFTDGTSSAMIKITADNVLHVGLGQYSKCTDSGNGYSTWINAGADLRFRLKNPDTNWRPYYAKGHSVSVKIYRAGFITTSKTELMFFVPLSKPIVGNPTVSVSSVDGLVVRQNGDYCFSKIISTDPVKPSSYTAAVVGGGCGINIKAKFSDTTNVTNNDACGVYASIKITFS